MKLLLNANLYFQGPKKLLSIHLLTCLASSVVANQVKIGDRFESVSELQSAFNASGMDAFKYTSKYIHIACMYRWFGPEQVEKGGCFNTNCKAHVSTKKRNGAVFVDKIEQEHNHVIQSFNTNVAVPDSLMRGKLIRLPAAGAAFNCLKSELLATVECFGSQEHMKIEVDAKFCGSHQYTYYTFRCASKGCQWSWNVLRVKGKYVGRAWKVEASHFVHNHPHQSKVKHETPPQPPPCSTRNLAVHNEEPYQSSPGPVMDPLDLKHDVNSATPSRTDNFLQQICPKGTLNQYHDLLAREGVTLARLMTWPLDISEDLLVKDLKMPWIHAARILTWVEEQTIIID